MSGAQPASGSPPARRGRWLIAWAVTVVALMAAAGLAVVPPVYASRKAEAGRQAAALDPEADEPGVTAANRALPADSRPARVLAGVYVDRVIELSVRDVYWRADFYVWFRWRGDVPKTCKDFQVVDGTIESQSFEVDETIAGERYQRFKVVARITKFFDVVRFPYDDHLLTVAVEHPAYTRRELLFKADQENTAVSSRVDVPAFRLRPPVALEKPHSYKTTRGDPRLPPGDKATHSQLRVGIGLVRAGWGLHFKLFQSLWVAVALALLASFVCPTRDPRFGLGVGALFAAVANAYVIASLVPNSGALALADVVNAVGIGTILLTVVQSTISLHLYTIRKQEALSRAFDRWSFATILPCYVLLNFALYWAACPPD
jgi:hypothetical protein